MLTHSTVTGLEPSVRLVDSREEDVTVPLVTAMVLAVEDAVHHHHQSTKVLSMATNTADHLTKVDRTTKATTAVAATATLTVHHHLTMKVVPEAHHRPTDLHHTTRLVALRHHHRSPRTLPRAPLHHQRLKPLSLTAMVTTVAHHLTTDAADHLVDAEATVMDIAGLTDMSTDTAPTVTATVEGTADRGVHSAVPATAALVSWAALLST